MIRASLLLLLVGAATVAHGFYRDTHKRLIGEAFDAVPGADDYADRHAAEAESARVDLPATNNEANQYRHSMRPTGDLLPAAQTKAAGYMKQELDAAVRLARLRPLNKVQVGYHLGLVLHLIQDRKHNWTSCGPLSNPHDSDTACDSSKPGCPAGMGNHGLTFDCLRPGSDPNFQHDTDQNPADTQLDRARAESIDMLRGFLAEVQKR
jgi:hypothetical protein